MIVCHCMNISDRDIGVAVGWMRAADPACTITPSKIYRALGKSPDCGGCMPLFLSTVAGNENTKVEDVPIKLRGLRIPANSEGESHEGRRQGHRLSKSGASQ